VRLPSARGATRKRSANTSRVVSSHPPMAHSRLAGRASSHPISTIYVSASPHAFHLPLGAMTGPSSGPDGRLLAVSPPVTPRGAPEGIPTGPMLPMIMTSAERKAVLRPDDLGAHLKAPAGALDAILLSARINKIIRVRWTSASRSGSVRLLIKKRRGPPPNWQGNAPKESTLSEPYYGTVPQTADTDVDVPD
jgi:hypothetical protein